MTSSRSYAFLLVVSVVALAVGTILKLPNREENRASYVVARYGKYGSLVAGILGVLSVVRYLLML